jgi:DNA-binding response OmpR family regulator
MTIKDILLVEDDHAAAHAIRTPLESRGEFRVDAVATAADALRRLGQVLPHAVLLDTTLPDLPAQEVCRAIRSRPRTEWLPCIMLGDRTRGLRSVEGLAFGADDYLTKPVDPGELQARLHALLRRRAPRPMALQLEAFRGIHIEANFADISIAIDGAPVSLTRRELLLLQALVEQRNRTVSRERLSSAWGSSASDCRVVDSAMWKLRKKLRGAGSQIETVVGFGYRFNEPQA